MKKSRRFVIEELTPADKDAFGQLYDLYAALFPLPDEREPPEAFAAIHALNQNIATQQQYGPYREIVAAIRAWRGGPIIGGHIFGLTTSDVHSAHDIPASVQVIYTFIHPAYRGTIPMADLIQYCRDTALNTFAPNDAVAGRPLIFFEVNNPMKMTADEIEADRIQAGIHPARRYQFWIKCGFAPLKFPYVQPRLRDDAEPVRYLDLFCDADARAVPGPVLSSHLRAFVSVSVLKSKDANDDADFRSMRDWLDHHDLVEVLPKNAPEIQHIAVPRSEPES